MGGGITARYSHGAVVAGTTMVIFGGVDTNGKILGDMGMVDLEKMKWVKCKFDKAPKPSPRYQFSFTAAYPDAILRSSRDIFSLNQESGRRVNGIYMFGGKSVDGPTSELWLLQARRNRADEGILS